MAATEKLPKCTTEECEVAPLALQNRIDVKSMHGDIAEIKTDIKLIEARMWAMLVGIVFSAFGAIGSLVIALIKIVKN